MPTSTGKCISQHRVMDKLPFVQSSGAVRVETIQTDHMTLGTLGHQDRTPAGWSTDTLALTLCMRMLIS